MRSLGDAAFEGVKAARAHGTQAARIEGRSAPGLTINAPPRPRRGAVFAFLTTESNPLVSPIHPKAMPVLLDKEDEERWLICSFDDAVALAKPHPSQLMAVMQAEPKASLDTNVVADTQPSGQAVLDLG